MHGHLPIKIIEFISQLFAISDSFTHQIKSTQQMLFTSIYSFHFMKVKTRRRTRCQPIIDTILL